VQLSGHTRVIIAIHAVFLRGQNDLCNQHYPKKTPHRLPGRGFSYL
jgi:hypothetical protein